MNFEGSVGYSGGEVGRGLRPTNSYIIAGGGRVKRQSATDSAKHVLHERPLEFFRINVQPRFEQKWPKRSEDIDLYKNEILTKYICSQVYLFNYLE